MPLNLLQKIEPENFPFKALQSNDGSGNLVAYASGSPGSGWADPGTTYEGKTFLIEFLDYFVAVEYDGAAWVEKTKVPKLTLYSTSEKDTGLRDSNGDVIYSQYFNIASNDVRFSTAIGNPISGTKGYILLDYGTNYFKNMYPMKVTRRQDYGFGPIKYYQYFGYDVFLYNNNFGGSIMWAIGFNTAAFSAIEFSDTSTYLIEIYYTKN